MINCNDCQACALYQRPEGLAPKHHHLAVPGEGPVPASIMVVGEAPGADEADSGRPLMGASGKRFDMLLKVAGIPRGAIFITNLVKHRPPNNRNPYVREIKACAHFLEEQLVEVQPQVVIALGRFAARYFDSTVALTKDHGLAKSLSDRPFRLIPMYHPAAALYDANLWAVEVADWSKVKETIGGKTLSGAQVPPNYSLATDREAAALASASSTLGFDLETTSPKQGHYLAVQETEVVGYSVSWADGQAVYVDGPPGAIVGVLESPLHEKICHQAKFEYGVLKRRGVQLTNYQDTKVAAWLLQHHNTGLKALARQLLGRDPITYEQVTEGADMSSLEPEAIAEYAAADADNALLLWPILRKQLREAGLWSVYQDIELPLIPVLHDMERRGVLVDQEAAQQTLQDLDKEIENAYGRVYTLGLPSDASVGSTDQLAKALEKLGAPIRARTDSKKLLKTDEEHLLAAKAAGWMPELVDAILEFRGLRKLRGYAASYQELIGPDGRLHPDFVQAGYGEEASDNTSAAPVTGRLSCRGPNLQNQPKIKGGQWVVRLRNCLVAPPGHSFVSADIGQEEPRIAAFVTKEPTLTRLFAQGGAVYGIFGQGIFQRPVDKQKHPQEWDVAKKSVLSYIWGSEGAKSWAPSVMDLAADHKLLLTLEDATSAYSRLEAMLPRIGQWRREVWETLRKEGYVRDWFGRRRLLPKIYGMDRMQAHAAWREAMNFYIQGPAASVLKLAMRRVWGELSGMAACIILSVHDEVVVECPDEEVAQVLSILQHMTNNLMPIYLPVELKVGKTWGNMEVVP